MAVDEFDWAEEQHWFDELTYHFIDDEFYPDQFLWLFDKAEERKGKKELKEWLSVVRKLLEEYEAHSAEIACDVDVDESTFTVRSSGKECFLGSTVQFRLMRALAASPGSYVTRSELAKRMGGDALDDIRHVKSRLCTCLIKAGMVNLAKCIKTEGKCYALRLASSGSGGN